MLTYVAVDASLSLEDVCERLEDEFGLSKFQIHGHERLGVIAPWLRGWEHASTRDPMRVHVARAIPEPSRTRTQSRSGTIGSTKPSIETWMPNTPSGANYQIQFPLQFSSDISERVSRALAAPATVYAQVETLWTILHEVDAAFYRAQQTSSLDWVAHLDLRLTPTPDVEEVGFESIAVMSDGYERLSPNEEQFLAETVEIGIRDTLDWWAMTGRPLGYFKVVLTELTTHLTDFNSQRYAWGAMLALNEVLEAHAEAL